MHARISFRLIRSRRAAASRWQFHKSLFFSCSCSLEKFHVVPSRSEIHSVCNYLPGLLFDGVDIVKGVVYLPSLIGYRLLNYLKSFSQDVIKILSLNNVTIRWKVFIDDICQVIENKQHKTENCPSNQAEETVMFSLPRIVLFIWIRTTFVLPNGN